MTGTRRRTACGALLLACLLTSAIAAADGSHYAGRPIVDVLLEFRDARLDFIYSSELVPATLRVLEEPHASNRLLIAREILQAHGLVVSVVRPGLYAVVPATRSAQERVVHGQVLDAASGEPISTARVVLLPLGAVAWSDAQGRFSIGPVPEGIYALEAEAPGFEAIEVPGLSVSGEAKPTALRLTPASTQLSEVVVSTSRYALDRFATVRISGYRR